MRLYLDSSVFQFLKKDENKELYDLVLKDKSNNIYCFSEAHVYDLIQDKTSHKLDDMTFIETIVDNNCWHFDSM